MDDFRKEDGNIDWKEYERAEMNFGERCHNCGAFIGIGKGERRLCYPCSEMFYSKKSFAHSKLVRCPKCQFSFDITDSDYYDLFSEGEHEIYCPECSHKFEIQTSVEYSFESPELLESGD